MISIGSGRRDVLGFFDGCRLVNEGVQHRGRQEQQHGQRPRYRAGTAAIPRREQLSAVPGVHVNH